MWPSQSHAAVPHALPNHSLQCPTPCPIRHCSAPHPVQSPAAVPHALPNQTLQCHTSCPITPCSAPRPAQSMLHFLSILLPIQSCPCSGSGLSPWGRRVQTVPVPRREPWSVAQSSLGPRATQGASARAGQCPGAPSTTQQPVPATPGPGQLQTSHAQCQQPGFAQHLGRKTPQ